VNTQAELWAVTGELAEPARRPAQGFRAAELDRLFDDLGKGNAAQRRDAEDAIWAVWCDHPDPAAREQMAFGIAALAGGQLDQARALFDQLVDAYPDWAETWNKRATVLFLLHADAVSVADIRRTLELEPRHFGALGGLAQIALRNGDPDAATAALRALLRCNPRAAGVADLLETIDRDAPKTVH
jgi:tetratricopeptide (TPR) repeat protein